MGKSKIGKAVNGFLLKEKRQNGKINGVQSLNNQKTYVFIYDDRIDDYIGKWIDTPSFVQKSLNVNQKP